MDRALAPVFEGRPAMLEESYQAGIDAFAKDPRVPPEVFKDLSEQLVGLKGDGGGRGDVLHRQIEGLTGG